MVPAAAATRSDRQAIAPQGDRAADMRGGHFGAQVDEQHVHGDPAQGAGELALPTRTGVPVSAWRG
jgi:hypothetical protein